MDVAIVRFDSRASDEVTATPLQFAVSGPWAAMCSIHLEVSHAYGPIETVVKFPGNQFTGEIAPALADLVENGIIRVIDLLFVSKGDNGTVEVVEIARLGDDVYGERRPCRLDVTGMLNEEDAQHFAGLLSRTLRPDSCSSKIPGNLLCRCGRKCEGEVVFNERIHAR